MIRALDALRTLGPLDPFRTLCTLRPLDALVPLHARDALGAIFAALDAVFAPVFATIFTPVGAELVLGAQLDPQTIVILT